MRHWTRHAHDMINKDGWVILATIYGVHGSIPRDAGTKMLIGPENITGTIGGGTLEHMIITQARLMGAAGACHVKQMDIPLGPKSRQCCGGRVELLLERLNRSHLPLLTAIAAADENLQPAQLVTALRTDRPHKEIMPAAAIMEKTENHFNEPLGDQRIPLFLFGAGHVGAAITERMSGLPFRVTWVDNRKDTFPANVPDNVQICLTASSGEIARTAPAGSVFLVMTYSHQIDFAVTAAILAREDAAYCGLIGSKTKRNRFIKRFQEQEGLSRKACDQLICPIGLPSIKGKEPEVIAIGVIAQLLEIFGQNPRITS